MWLRGDSMQMRGVCSATDYGVVDEGKDFQLKPGLAGIAVLDHVVCVYWGWGSWGERR